MSKDPSPGPYHQEEGSSRSYYYAPAPSSRDGRPHNLPSIREVVGDVLQQPVVRPASSMGFDGRYSLTPPPLPPAGRHPGAGAQPHYHSQRFAEIPLQRYATHPPYVSRGTVAFGHEEHAKPRGRKASHSYDVFVSNPGTGLIHKRSSTIDDFSHVPKEDAIASSTGKHMCDECGRRFEKLSTLKNHLTTHTGEKPHVCPDCGKAFSVSSNMRRHLLTHRNSGSSR